MNDQEIEWLMSLSGKPPFMLRQAQHERDKVNVFNIHSVHPELVEGSIRVCRTGSFIPNIAVEITR